MNITLMRCLSSGKTKSRNFSRDSLSAQRGTHAARGAMANGADERLRSMPRMRLKQQEVWLTRSTLWACSDRRARP